MHITVGAILVEGIMRNISLKLFEYMIFSGCVLKMFLF